MNFLRGLLDYILRPIRALLSAPGRLFGAPKRLWGMSLPARVAVLLGIFLTVVVIVTFVAYLISPETLGWQQWLEPWHILVLLALVIAIPWVTYFALKLWLEGEVSPYEDIDRAWREGVAELERNGYDWNRIPIFLVLGAPEATLADALMEASSMQFGVVGVPEGRAPLRWFANDQAIFLFCCGAGRLARVNRSASELSASSGPAPALARSAAAGIRGTLVAGGGIRGTALPGEADAEEGIDEMSGGQPEPAGGPVSFRQTLVPGNFRQTLVPGQSAAAPEAGPAPAVAVPRQDLEQESDRLEYVCRLLNRLRQPLCPINGLLVLVPWKVVLSPLAQRDVPESIRRDLDSVRHGTSLCCPVLALVSGLEGEPGFLELMRRIGVDQARAARFGRGFDHWTTPTTENMDALASHACGAFEDWVYDLFQRPDGLSKPGNAKLYTLLCRIRSQIQSRLRVILMHGFGSDPSEAAEGRGQLFGGCYFAATGESADRQSFVRGVVDKLIQLEEELEWTEDAVRQDQRYRGWANALLLANAALLVALLGLAGFSYFKK